MCQRPTAALPHSPTPAPPPSSVSHLAIKDQFFMKSSGGERLCFVGMSVNIPHTGVLTRRQTDTKVWTLIKSIRLAFLRAPR